ncbi:MAG: hsp20 [Microbacteriaceae bacterium]|jgi:HSP20 family protein|nr:hsp20 [Microbacteriaceae bacterium]
MARNVARFNPLAELDALQKQFFGDDFLTRFSAASVPTTDVYMQNDEQMTIEVHLPNFNEADIGINIDEGALVIQAEKREREEDKKKKYMVRESSASFYRRIALPDRADEENINARFENGVLSVVVPFKELPSPKKIAINSGGSASNQQAQLGESEPTSNRSSGGQSSPSEQGS